MFPSLVQKMMYVFLIVLLIGELGKGDTLGEDEDHDGVGSVVEEEEDPDEGETTVLPPGMQKLSFKPANLTEEDHHSLHMPSDLMCDGCRVVAHIVAKRLNRIQSRYKEGHRLLESDVIDILDNACRDEDSFNEYGVKEVKGKKRLSGEGLETKDEAGMMQGGGKWPHRLQQMCEQYVGNLGDEVIYEEFLVNGSLENLFCYSEENGNVCYHKTKDEL
ncbi:marginal zone B- and B1-cell-specific protein-like [Babylonia areolata]|uniref:marginal zone B- and B1-cell-specific protein-like n=1 Tax=Babylonia areolata TaxID=304850 RepID=UPI003FD1CFF7